MLKSTAGGGGIGMRSAATRRELARCFERVERLAPQQLQGMPASSSRSSSRTARHIEVQIFGDGKGSVVALGERDCSAQRRNQKVIEETPAPGPAADDARGAVATTARPARRARELSLAPAPSSSSTTPTADEFYFLEVNTRLQVEHGVTEEVTGVDLVEWMVRLAAGELPPLDRLRIEPQRRIDPGAPLCRGSRPRFPAERRAADATSPSRRTRASRPGSRAARRSRRSTIRCSRSSSSRGATRDEALAQAAGGARRDRARRASRPISTICASCRRLRRLRRGEVLTRYAADASPTRPRPSKSLDAGTQTTVQDYPGRIGYWDVGVPPSGPMDALAFRSPTGCSAMPKARRGWRSRCPGPTLQFNSDARDLPAGADMHGDARRRAGAVSGSRSPSSAGQVLQLGGVDGAGRARLSRRPRRLRCAAISRQPRRPSRSASSAAMAGARCAPAMCCISAPNARRRRRWRPLAADIDAAPHATPGKSACSTARTARRISSRADDIDTFFAADWKVHYNSNPHRRAPDRPEAAMGARRRRRSGAASLQHPRQRLCHRRDRFHRRHADHPGPGRPEPRRLRLPGDHRAGRALEDGPASPGRHRSLPRLTPTEAARACEARRRDRRARSRCIRRKRRTPMLGARRLRRSAVLPEAAATAERRLPPRGRRYLLVEYGPIVLDLELRFRVHALMQCDLERASALPGIIDLTPGIRSLQIHYDTARAAARAI